MKLKVEFTLSVAKFFFKSWSIYVFLFEHRFSITRQNKNACRTLYGSAMRMRTLRGDCGDCGDCGDINYLYRDVPRLAAGLNTFLIWSVSVLFPLYFSFPISFPSLNYSFRPFINILFEFLYHFLSQHHVLHHASSFYYVHASFLPFFLCDFRHKSLTSSKDGNRTMYKLSRSYFESSSVAPISEVRTATSLENVASGWNPTEKSSIQF